ncbi:heme biosynthesis operon protein HemX, partial [Pseudomonas gingeri]|nr:heme biosynthesis operon protein HemX [Pseudomonas gingeri]
MSETALPKEEAQPVPEAPVKPPVAPVERRGNGLAILALLLGAAGVAAGGWGV